jgi:hypothetical protein
MRTLLRYLVAACALLLMAGQPASAGEETLDFNGNWQGKIVFDKETFLAETSTPAAGMVFRIEVHDFVVRVFLEGPNGMEESKPGAFHIAPAAANAIVFGTNSNDTTQGWTESWVFVVSQRDHDTLSVQYVRQVNNAGLPADDKERVFAARGTGTFKRAPAL